VLHGSYYYYYYYFVCVFERGTYILLSAQTYIYIYIRPTVCAQWQCTYFGEKHFVSGWILFTRVTHSLRNRHNTVGRKQTDTRPTTWNMCRRRRRRRRRDGGIVTGVSPPPVCLYFAFSLTVPTSLTRSFSRTHHLSFISGSPRNGTCSADRRQIFENFATAGRRRSLRRSRERTRCVPIIL